VAILAALLLAAAMIAARVLWSEEPRLRFAPADDAALLDWNSRTHVRSPAPMQL
jgi:hypothetical protein